MEKRGYKRIELDHCGIKLILEFPIETEQEKEESIKLNIRNILISTLQEQIQGTPSPADVPQKERIQ